MNKFQGKKNKEFFNSLVDIVKKESYLDPKLYDEYDIKRGLRNANGSGVLVGVTHIASVLGYKEEDGKKVPMEGQLLYQGIPLREIVHGFESEGRMGFEEVIYLLLFGYLPTAQELLTFNRMLDSLRDLPAHYKEDVILKIPSHDIMNKIQRNILCLYSYDDDPDNTSTENVLFQSMNLIAKFPVIVAYCYQAKRHYLDNDSLVLHQPISGIGTAESILSLIRHNSKYSREEAELLDTLLVVHAEHGGGNNSAFATHVVSSSGTDTYSAISTAIGSLKGPKHGGAALKVAEMFEEASTEISDLQDDDEIRDYINQLLDKEAYDKSGLIYGMGHAVYTLSDPRAELLKQKAAEVAQVKGEEYVEFLSFLMKFEDIAAEEMEKRMNRGYKLSANVDFYSGFVYNMLGFPRELFAPMFATARMAGWCAHRLEQLTDSKIIRPGYVTVGERKPYLLLDERVKHI